MADPLEYTLVRLDNNIKDKAILTYDVLRDTITDSGLTGHRGEIQASSGTIKVGMQDMSSAGEQVIWRNRQSDVNYAPPWHIIDEVNPGGSSDRFYGAVQTSTRFAIRTDILEDPIFNVNIPLDEVVFRLDMTFPEARTNVEFALTLAGFDEWREIKDVSAGKQLIVLDMPIAFRTGDHQFSIKEHPTEGVVTTPVKVMGEAQTGRVGYDVVFRAFTEKPLATKEYVINTVTGGVADDVMLKSVYDKTDTGKVDMASHSDKAATLDGGPSATINQYYGKNDNGILGFHTITTTGAVPDTSNKVYVKEFTTPYTLGAKELDSDRVPYYIYIGTTDSIFSLPYLTNMESESIIFGVMNNSNAKLTIKLRTGDGWNGDDTIKSYEMKSKTGVILVSDLAQSTWYTSATMDSGHFTETESRLLTNENDIKKHETSIDAHGVQLANHASQIKGADNVANSALTQSQHNLETIITNRKNSIKGVTFEQDKASKTITLKFISDAGIVDTGVIDLTGWFDGGVVPPSTDHKIYYGFASRIPMSESDVLRLGTYKTVPTVAGLDINIVRSGQASSFIYVWLPDSAGTIKGFTFSGFLSVWNSTALTIAGSTGKFYSSPNKTSATNVNFEVTQ